MAGDPHNLGEFVRLFYPDADQAYVEAHSDLIGKMEERRRFAVLTKGFSVQEHTIRTAQLAGNHPGMILIDDPHALDVLPYNVDADAHLSVHDRKMQINAAIERELLNLSCHVGLDLSGPDGDMTGCLTTCIGDIPVKSSIPDPYPPAPGTNRAARRRAAAQARKRR